MDKFLWREGDRDWGAYRVTLNKSAKGVLAEMFELRTYKGAFEHQKKNGDLPRIVKKIPGGRSILFQQAIKFPAPYENRMFEMRLVWKEIKLSNNRLGYLVGSFPLRGFDEFPNNTNMRFIKADVKGVSIITEVAPSVCSTLRIQSIDLKMSLPKRLLEKMAKVEIFSTASRLEAQFRRNAKKVDAEVRAVTVEKMVAGVELEKDQKEMFRDLEEFIGGASAEKGWKPIDSPFGRVKMEMKYQQQKRGERSVALGRAEGVVDCTAEEATAWLFNFCGRERKAVDRDEGNPARFEMIKAMGDERENEKVFVNIKTMRPARARIFVTRFVWKRNEEDGSLSLGLWPSQEPVDSAKLNHMVRGATKALINITNIKGIGDVPQCEVKIVQFINAGGFIPERLVNIAIPYALNVVDEISKKFRRGAEIDHANLISLAKIIKNKEPQNYTTEEEEVLAKGKQFFLKCLRQAHMRSEKLKCDDSLVKVKSVAVEGTAKMAGICEAIIDADIATCVAYDYIKDSWERKARHKERGIVGEYVKKISDHSQLFYTRRDLRVPGFAHREFRNHCIWKRDDDGRVWTGENWADFKGLQQRPCQER